MVVLNWNTGIGNITLDTGSPILVPFQTALPSLLPSPLPAPATAQPDVYGIYFLVESLDPTTGAPTFKVDSNGYKIPYGFTSYQTNNLTNDYLAAIGYPPGVRGDGTYDNALSLTTIRMGGGNDIFTVIGEGVNQSLSAEVSKEASQGYIFQSNIFAGAGDDVVRALMPWQSTFKGGSNTVYYDGRFGSDPGGGIAIILDDDLTLEEVSFGDLIELKGSRFDWDIEFKDGNGDGQVSLASILDEQDYIATSNNNRIYGFERIRFGDIYFDLNLSRQQDSSSVYGQPDYFLNGVENQAPELNSNIAAGSGLWEAFRFNRTKLQGISGTATQPIAVHTGDAGDTPFVIGALQFAALLTEKGDDIAEIGSGSQALIDLGEGSDQLKVGGLFSRSEADGNDGDDNIIFNNVSNSTVFGGDGNDIIEILTSTLETSFDGGNGEDSLLLPGLFSKYNLSSSNSSGLVTFADADGNSFTGFESIRFSDINLDALQTLSLIPAASTVAEGGTASYGIALSGSGLARGSSVAFSLQLSNGSAQVSSDLAALAASALQAAAGIVLRNVTVDATSGWIRAVASASRDFNPAATIATLSLPAAVDLQTEPAETFSVTLADFVAEQSVTTTITNVLPVTIGLTGPASVTEGQTASYSVNLDGVGLAPDHSVTFSLESADGSARAGLDFAALVTTSLQKADGITFSGISTAADGSVMVTATNTSGGTLPVGAELLSLQLPITTDATVEGSETFSVTLASNTAVVSQGLVTTTISDLVPVPSIGLIGETSVVEGQSTAYAVSLTGSGLLAGQSITFTLDSASGSALEQIDFASLTAAGLTAAAGVTLSTISTDPVSKAVTVTATNSSGTSLPAGSQLVSFELPTTADLESEDAETFFISLSSASASISVPSLATTITDDDTPALQLSGSQSVAEGAPAAYSLALDGVGLGAGQSITVSLQSTSGSATRGFDFSTLTAADLTAAAGVTLSTTPADPVSKAVTLTATNSSGTALPAGSRLLGFSLPTFADLVVEDTESFSVSLTSTSATVNAASVVTTITDGDTPALKLTGSRFVAEGAAAAYSLALDGVGLGAGQSITVSLQSTSGSAAAGPDFSALSAAALNAAPGISLRGLSTSRDGRVSVTAVNTSGADLGVGAELLNVRLRSKNDRVAEGEELYALELSSSTTSVATATRTTTIEDDDPLAIRLLGTTAIREGAAARYVVGLHGVGLGAGESIRLSLATVADSAWEEADFATLVAEDLSAEADLTLSRISTDPLTGALTVTVTNSGGTDLESNARLFSVSLATRADALVEGQERFAMRLASENARVHGAVVHTALEDGDRAVLRLTGSALVREGENADYAVVLDGVALASGRSLTLVLDTAGGTASQGSDVAALVAAGLKAAPGVKLSSISSDPGSGAVRVTVTNRSSADLPEGAQLLGFTLNTTDDSEVESSETYRVTLTSGSALISTGTVTTTISDNDIPSPVSPSDGGGSGQFPAAPRPGSQFLNGGKADDILDQVFGKGRSRSRRQAADPIVDSRQRRASLRAGSNDDRDRRLVLGDLAVARFLPMGSAQDDAIATPTPRPALGDSTGGLGRSAGDLLSLL